MPPAARPLRTVLAAGLKEARLRQGLRQEDAASRARAYGLSTWIRGTVAQAEVGGRRLALEEVLLLAMAYETSLADLIGGNETDLVELTPQALVPVGTVRALVSGQPVHSTDGPAQPTAGRRSGRFPEVLGPGRFGLGDRTALARPAGTASDAERHAARKLASTPEAVADAADRLWGRSLDDERDHRLSERATKLSARSAQAQRGHITRDLLTELARELADSGDAS